MTLEFNTLRKISFHVRIKEATKSLACKSQVDNLLDIAGKNREKKLQTFDLSYFNGGMYFYYDGSQTYLIFQPIYNTSTRPNGNTEAIVA